MSSRKEQQIGLKLGLAFGVLIVILMVIGYLGLSRMDRTNSELNDILGRRWAKLQLARQRSPIPTETEVLRCRCS